VESIGLVYWVGVDGFSLFLLGLTSVLSLVALVGVEGVDSENPPQSPFTKGEVKVRTPPFEKGGLGGISSAATRAWILLLQAGLTAVWLALDVLFAWMSFEICLGVLYLGIRLQTRNNTELVKAANRFFVLQQVAALLILLSLLPLIEQAGNATDFASLLGHRLSVGQQQFWGLVFLLGLMIQSGLFPFQSGLNRLLRVASPVIFILTTGLFIKVGVFWALRFAYPLFKAGWTVHAHWIQVLSVLSLVLAAMAVLPRFSLKERLISLSLGHMGFVWFGISLAERYPMQGALALLVAHGLMMALGVFLLGSSRSQIFSLLSGIQVLAIPGTWFFVGFYLILLSAFSLSVPLAALMGLAWILSAGAFFLGLWNFKVPAPVHRPRKFWLSLVGLLVLLWLGSLFPQSFLMRTEQAVTQWIEEAP